MSRKSKGNLFCLAGGQTIQSKVLLLLHETILGTIDYNRDILWLEGCPNLLCQRLVLFRTELGLQESIEFTKLREESLERTSEIDLGKLIDANCSV